MKHSNNPNQYSISATEKRKLERLLQKGYVSNATKHFFFFFFFANTKNIQRIKEMQAMVSYQYKNKKFTEK